ncbi:hypothetical protein QYF36_000008 [Acer negundo]|nr:hypothetical protein QYF36_000008 [Acer negundo]
MAGPSGGNQVQMFDFMVSWFVKWGADIVGIFCAVLWRVWYNRNQVTHGKAGLDLREVVGWAENFLIEYRSANQVHGHQLGPLCNRNDVWRPPAYDSYKVNTDAAIDTSPPSVPLCCPGNSRGDIFEGGETGTK